MQAQRADAIYQLLAAVVDMLVALSVPADEAIARIVEIPIPAGTGS